MRDLKADLNYVTVPVGIMKIKELYAIAEHALNRAINAEAEVERLKEEAHQDIEWLYKEYVLEADVNLSQDAIDLKRKLRDMVCKELQAENAKLRAVVDAARGVFLGEGEYLCSEFEDAMNQLEQALAELDKEGE